MKRHLSALLAPLRAPVAPPGLCSKEGMACETGTRL